MQSVPPHHSPPQEFALACALSSVRGPEEALPPHHSPPQEFAELIRILGGPGPLAGQSLGIGEKMQSVGGPGGENKRGQAGMMQILGGPGPSCATIPGG